MITIQLKGPKGLEKLTSLPENMQRTLLQGMKDGIQLIISTSTRKYMAGPYPMNLSTDSGWLRKGLYGNAWMAGTSGEFIHAEVGNYVRKYARTHEQTGLPGTTFQINAKDSKKGMSFFWRRMGFWMYHVWQVRIPARPFLWPAIMDNIEPIRLLLNRSIREAYKKSTGTP
jgi:hypothetical protein